MAKYWRSNRAESLKPHVGQQFVSLDSAFGFYKQYAGSVGFDCRQSTTRKGRDGVVVLKQVVCSREGFKQSSSSTSSTTQSTVVKRRRVTNRVGCKAKVVFKVFTYNPFGMGASSSCGCGCCGGCGTSDTGIDRFPSSGGAFSSFKAVSTCPYPNPPDFISSRSLLDSSLNVQFLKAGKLLGTMRLKSTTRRAKWRLNHGSAASTSTIFLVNALGVIYAVVFSKNHLHSFNISGIAFVVLFVISIFPFGRPRTATTSLAVIWIVCPFWSCNVQLLGSNFSTNHSPIWRGKLVITRSRRLPRPMSFTTWRCAGLSYSTALVSIFGSALIFRPSSSALMVSSSASVCSGLSTSSAWAGCSSSICSRWGCCACSVGCSSSRSCPGSAVDVRGSLLVDVFPSSIVFRLLPA
nr:protein FAR1-RELATED SEQUENCE 5-like [Ipomoea batatas]